MDRGNQRRRKRTRHSIWAVFLAFTCGYWAFAQTLTRRPAKPAATSPDSVAAKKADDSIPLTVPAGSPLKLALDQEVRIHKVGSLYTQKWLSQCIRSTE
jgi:hypothetical protein